MIPDLTTLVLAVVVLAVVWAWRRAMLAAALRHAEAALDRERSRARHPSTGATATGDE